MEIMLANGPTERATHKPKQRDRKDSGCDSEEVLFKNCIVCDVPQTLYSYKSSTFHHFWDHVQYHWSKGDIPTEEPRRSKTSGGTPVITAESWCKSRTRKGTFAPLNAGERAGTQTMWTLSQAARPKISSARYGGTSPN